MTIQLTLEQERIIREEIQNGHFRSADDVLDHALTALQEQERKRKTPAQRKESLSEFLMHSPLAGSGLNLERDNDPGRTIEL